jgi:cell division protein FtsL
VSEAVPALRLVGPSSRRRRVVTRMATGLAATLAAGGLFAVVTLHIFLTAGQADLDRLQARTDAETTRNGRLTVEVAELESPERVSQIARDRLGMVPPSTVVYLPAADPASPLPAVPAAPAAGTQATTAKPAPSTTVASRSPATTAARAASTPTTLAHRR